jgi:hypothetical protein
MVLLAILFPTLYFLFSGQILKGIVCFILQITILGWLPASLWALVDYFQRKEDARTERMIREMRR